MDGMRNLATRFPKTWGGESGDAKLDNCLIFVVGWPDGEGRRCILSLYFCRDGASQPKDVVVVMNGWTRLGFLRAQRSDSTTRNWWRRSDAIDARMAKKVSEEE